MHRGAAQFFGGIFLTDGRLDERRPCEKEAAAVGHQDVVTHHGQIAATGDAHSHNCGDLGNAHGGHDRIVAKDAAKVVGVGEDVLLKRKEYACGVDEVDGRDAVLDGDVLGTNDLLRGHGKERACLHGGVVNDEHHQASVNAGESGDDAGSGSAAPLFVHAVGSVNAEFEEGAGVNQQVDSLAGYETSLAVLALDSLRAPTLANLFFLVVDDGDQVGHGAHIGFKARGGRVHFGGKGGVDGQSTGFGGVSTVSHKRVTRNYLRYNSGEERGKPGHKPRTDESLHAKPFTTKDTRRLTTEGTEHGGGVRRLKEIVSQRQSRCRNQGVGLSDRGELPGTSVTSRIGAGVLRLHWIIRKRMSQFRSG